MRLKSTQFSVKFRKNFAQAPDVEEVLRMPNMSPVFYDTHAHLDYKDYAEDLPQVIERAQAAGITKIITIGTDLESSSRAIQLAERFEPVYAAVGWHPSYVTEAPADIRPELRKMAAHPKVVAIGETGLDYHHLPSEKPEASPEDDLKYKTRQRELFQQQMQIASEFGLNCIIHQRDALEDTLSQMEGSPFKIRGVVHCFVDIPASMERITKSGSLVSFTGIATFKNAQSVRDTIAATPADKLMLETDCPFLAPVPYRGKRCEPAYVKEISEAVAKVKNISREELSDLTCKTAHEFFPKMK